MNLNFFLKETYKRRTIYRLLFGWELYKNRQLFENKEVLDLGSGGNPSYGGLIYHLAKKVTKTDYKEKQGVDQILDFNKKFPFGEGSFDVVILCNALYIAENPSFVISEINRIIRPNGQFVLINPFVANEMPEPHDYERLTKEGIEKITEPFFQRNLMTPIGERGTVATYALQPIFFLWIIRIIGYSIGILVDKFTPKNVKKNHPFPLGYLYVGRKK